MRAEPRNLPCLNSNRAALHRSCSIITIARIFAMAVYGPEEDALNVKQTTGKRSMDYGSFVFATLLSTDRSFSSCAIVLRMRLATVDALIANGIASTSGCSR